MKIYLLSFLFAGVLFFVFASKVKAQVLINEFVPNNSPEWIEFYNASDSADYLRDYWIDDDLDFNSDSGNSSKKHLINLNIDSIMYPYFELSSVFNNSGDYVVLFNSNGIIIDQYQYTEDPGSGVSIGRSPDGSGNFFILTSVTKGMSNSLPTPSPTPSPTVSPTNPPTNTPSPSPTFTPTPRATATPLKTFIPTATPIVSIIPTVSPSVKSKEVLALKDQAKQTDTKEKVNVLPILVTGVGVIMVGLAAFPFVKSKLK